MKSKVWFSGILTSGIASVASLLNLRVAAAVFAVLSLIMLAMSVTLKNEEQ